MLSAMLFFDTRCLESNVQLGNCLYLLSMLLAHPLCREMSLMSSMYFDAAIAVRICHQPCSSNTYSQGGPTSALNLRNGGHSSKSMTQTMIPNAIVPVAAQNCFPNLDFSAADRFRNFVRYSARVQIRFSMMKKEPQ